MMTIIMITDAVEEDPFCSDPFDTRSRVVYKRLPIFPCQKQIRNANVYNKERTNTNMDEKHSHSECFDARSENHFYFNVSNAQTEC